MKTKIPYSYQYWECPKCQTQQYDPIDLLIYKCQKAKSCGWEGDRDQLLLSAPTNVDKL